MQAFDRNTKQSETENIPMREGRHKHYEFKETQKENLDDNFRNNQIVRCVSYFST